MGIEPKKFDTNFYEHKIKTNDEIHTEYLRMIGMSKNKEKSKPIPIPRKNIYLQ